MATVSRPRARQTAVHGTVTGQKVRDFPVLMSEWHPTRNVGFDPAVLAAGSNKAVWWRCAVGHEFRKSPNARTNEHRGTGQVSPCPECRRAGLWTWDRVVATARDVVTKEGHLPPASYFQTNDLAGLISFVYASGRTWEELRDVVDSFQGSSFVPSRSRIRWRSFPEAAVSNFLYARGVRHEKGRKYPPSYSEFSGKAYGYYDVLFTDRRGRVIDVEIWGDKPKGADPINYMRVRRLKERFVAGRDDFLGIHRAECSDERRLTEIFEPFVGVIEPYIFVEPHDPHLETSHWANADEVLATCRQIAATQPDGLFPGDQWLRKRHPWTNRDGPPYHTLSDSIRKWIGGLRKLRDLLGQSEQSTTKWDRESALAALKDWYDRHGKSPSAIRADHVRGKSALDIAEVRRGGAIASAITKHVGSEPDALRAIGVPLSHRVLAREWDRAGVLAALKKWHGKYGEAPRPTCDQAARGLRVLSAAEVKRGRALHGAIMKHIGSQTEALLLEGITPPRRAGERRRPRGARRA